MATDHKVRAVPLRYRSHEEDSERWVGFPFREGDVVISTRSKSGTTWVQMICALLVFQTPDLPAPLTELSPWLDWLITPRDEVFDRLAAQEHRRVIKTHTPLDGIPLDSRATYIVVAGTRSIWRCRCTTTAPTSTGPGCASSPGSPAASMRLRRGLRCGNGCSSGSVRPWPRVTSSTPCRVSCCTCPTLGPAGSGVAWYSCTTTTCPPTLTARCGALRGCSVSPCPRGPGPPWWRRPRSTACG